MGKNHLKHGTRACMRRSGQLFGTEGRSFKPLIVGDLLEDVLIMYPGITARSSGRSRNVMQITSKPEN